MKLLVKCKESTLENVERLIRLAGIEIDRILTSIDRILVEADKKQIEEIEAIPGVLKVEYIRDVHTP